MTPACGRGVSSCWGKAPVKGGGWRGLGHSEGPLRSEMLVAHELGHIEDKLKFLKT